MRSSSPQQIVAAVLRWTAVVILAVAMGLGYVLVAARYGLGSLQPALDHALREIGTLWPMLFALLTAGLVLPEAFTRYASAPYAWLIRVRRLVGALVAFAGYAIACGLLAPQSASSAAVAALVGTQLALVYLVLGRPARGPDRKATVLPPARTTELFALLFVAPGLLAAVFEASQAEMPDVTGRVRPRAARSGECTAPPVPHCAEWLAELPEPPVAIVPGHTALQVRVIGRSSILTYRRDEARVDGPWGLPEGYAGPVDTAAGSPYGELYLASGTKVSGFGVTFQPLFEFDTAVELGSSGHGNPLFAWALGHDAIHLDWMIANDQAMSIYALAPGARAVVRIGQRPYTRPTQVVPPPAAAHGDEAVTGFDHPENELTVWMTTPTTLYGIPIFEGATSVVQPVPFPASGVAALAAGRKVFVANALQNRIYTASHTVIPMGDLPVLDLDRRVPGAKLGPISVLRRRDTLVFTDREAPVVYLRPAAGPSPADPTGEDPLYRIVLPGGPLLHYVDATTEELYVANGCGLYRIHAGPACLDATKVY